MSLFNKKKEQPAQPQPQADESRKYTRAWLGKVAIVNGYAVNDEGGKVDGILGALERRDGHCPCGGNGEQFRCPCVIMRERAICKCGLFKTIPPRKVTGTSEVSKIERN
jgi:ferredoxin-thioredoxin reductase catalytic subunit